MYPLSVSITIHSLAELEALAKFSTTIGGSPHPTQPMPADAINAATQKATPEMDSAQKQAPKVKAPVAKPAAKPGKAEPAVKPAAEAAPKAAQETDYQQAARAVTDLVVAQGRDAGVALLAQFGVTTLKDAKPEQYAAVKAACEAALASEEVAA